MRRGSNAFRLFLDFPAGLLVRVASKGSCMSRLFAVSTCHMEPEIIAMSLARLRRTGGMIPDRHIIVSHHWPIDPHGFHDLVVDIAKICKGEVVQPERQLGGHFGFNFGLGHLELKDDDLVLGYDPDSYPAKRGWLKAMVEVMQDDPRLGYVSLMSEWIQGNRDWRLEMIGGHRVAFHPIQDMFNITVFRASVLKKGLLAEEKNPYYGNVETGMKRHVDGLGMRWGYMRDWLEDRCPIKHHPIYEEWKKKAGGEGTYKGNFDQYVMENYDRI